MVQSSKPPKLSLPHVSGNPTSYSRGGDAIVPHARKQEALVPYARPKPEQRDVKPTCYTRYPPKHNL